MSRSSNFQPNWASMPGDTIADILRARDVSIGAFAKKMNTNAEHIKELLHGYISITEEIAQKLSQVLGASTEFWLRREHQYRESVNRLRNTEEEKWVKDLPIQDMVKLGWISRTENLITACLKYFDVPDVWTWRKKYNEVIAFTAFRKSVVLKSTPASIAAWLRQGEIQIEHFQCNKWNPKLFNASLSEIRSLSKKKDPKEFIPKLRAICANCGVALAIVRTPNGCAASGATKFITSEKAMLLLSFRFLSDDQFWFTFFHEAGHLILHSDKSLFIEEENNFSKEEKEANEFAENILIPKEFQQRLRTMKPSKDEIIKLAKDADIPLGIVVGQLQYLKRLEVNYFNTFKRKYLLSDIMQVSH